MRKNHNDYSVVKNVDFDKLDEILKEKGIKKAELSRKCGYYPDYVALNVFRNKRLNWTVANMLERVYGISQDEYCYEQTETTASNDDTVETTASNDEAAEGTKENAITFAFKIDPDTADIVRRYAFLKNKKVKDIMREIIIEELGDLKLPEREDGKILPEYLDGKKTTTTISTDDTAETTASNDEPAEGTKQIEKTVTFAFRTTPKTAYAIKGYAYYKNKSVRAVMEEMIAKELNGVDLPKREDEEKK